MTASTLPGGESHTSTFAAELLPSPTPVRFLNERGKRVHEHDDRYPEPKPELLVETHRRMVIGRRFDIQATALTRQGRLAVYPSSHGQEACQVGGVLALNENDWIFPTYRESVAIITRDVDPVETLTLLRGDWHCGYDPYAHRVAAQYTPLSTQTLHATGLAHAARRKGEDTVALAYIGDGATSEGDFHEALNFAGVFKAPVIFLIQNNRYAISVPLAKQTAAPTLAHKGIGYGVAAEQIDGNDPMAVLAVTAYAAERARSGGGAFLVEAHTYRMEAHTNADDASRYRDESEISAWEGRDPIARLEAYLRDQGLLSDTDIGAVRQEAEHYAADLRRRMNEDPALDPQELFAHVYAEPTPQLREQAALLAEEIAAEHDDSHAEEA